MTTTPSTTRAVLSLLLAGLLLCACLLPACAVDLRDLPDWVRAQLFPVELDYQGMYPIPGLGPTLTPVAPAAAAATGTPATVSIPGAADVGALRTIGGSPAGVRPDGLATVGGPGAAAILGGLNTVGGPTVTGGGLGNLHTVGAPTVTGTLGTLGTVSVPGGRPGDLTALGGVSVSGAAPRTGDLQAFATKGIGRGAQCIDIIRAEHMTPEQFIAWADENGITTDEIVAAMQYSGIDWPELAPESMPLAAALHARLGAELAGIEDVPMAARLLLATYFGTQHRDDDVRKVYAAISDEEIRAEPRRHLYCVTSRLIHHVPVVALDVIERYATVVPEDRRLLTREFAVACLGIGGQDIVRHRLIPYCTEALEQMPPMAEWGTALSILVTAYHMVGEDARGSEQGLGWLRVAEDLGAETEGADYSDAKLAVARSCLRSGRMDELARLVPPAYEMTRPSRTTVRARVGQQGDTKMRVIGTCSLQVIGVASDSEWLHAELAGTSTVGLQTSWHIAVNTTPLQTAPAKPGTVHVRTNDPAAPTIEIPVEVALLPAVQVEAPGCLLPADSAGTAEVLVTSSVPVALSLERVDGSGPINVQIREVGPLVYRVTADFAGAPKPRARQGLVVIATGLPDQPRLVVPFIAPGPSSDGGGGR
ncbi:MAG TPA: hypothetical protein DGT21_07550 [Armatimonadetes bacterium]|jgi:hypothetical protein|nr:hypothetical protein [Armatimonadota bacterium]